MFNPRAWLVWIAAGFVVALLATNPLYLAILLLCAALVRAGCVTSVSAVPAWRFGLLLVGFSTVYNALLTHYGDTALVTLPRALPLVGGPVTLEAAAFGASRGLALWALLAVVTVINDVVSPYELVRLTPRFLRQAGLVVSIMLAFVPQTLRSLEQVREAQAIRGHRLRGVRDLVALVVPLMTDALEKAVQLAEAMEARGYGQRGQQQTANNKYQMLAAGGLSGILLGWLAEAYWRNGIGWASIAASSLVLMAGLRGVASQAARTTRYRPQAWSPRDTLLTALSALSLEVFVAVAWLNPDALSFYPYPRLALPAFDVRLGLCLVLLALPALLKNVERRELGVEGSSLQG